MSALREVIASFGISIEDEELEKFDKGLKGLVGRVQEAGKAFVEALAVKEIGEFFGSQIEMAARTQDLSDKLGVGTEALEQFQFAAKSAGVDGESAAQALGFLNKSIGEALTGSKESAETFAKLGVGLKDTAGNALPAGDVLFSVADSMGKLGNQQERAAYAMKLFGREGQTLLPILSKGSDGLRKMYGEADDLGVVMGGQFFKDAKKAREEIEHFHMVLQALAARVTSIALPAIEGLYNWFQRTLKPVMDMVKHTDILKESMGVLAGIAGVELVSALAKAGVAMGLLKPSILETLLALAEFALPIIAILLLGVAFEDLWKMLNGGKSVIGDMLTKLGGVEGKNKYVDDVKASWQQLLDLFSGDKSMDDQNKKTSTLVDSIQFLAGGFYELFTIAKTVFDLFIGLLNVTKNLTISIGKGLGGAFTNLLQSLNPFSDGKTDITGAFSRGFGNNTGKAIDKMGDMTMNDLQDIWSPGNHPAVATIPPSAQVPGSEWDSGPGQVKMDQPISYGVPSLPGAASSSPKVTQTNMINVTVPVSDAHDPKTFGNKVAKIVDETISRNNYNTLLAQKRR